MRWEGGVRCGGEKSKMVEGIVDKNARGVQRVGKEMPDGLKRMLQEIAEREKDG